MKIKNKNLAIFEVAEATPLKPNRAAMMATTKNTSAQYNITVWFSE